jgi:hypothetical protein
MPISTLAGVAFGVAVVSIGLYHLAFVGPRLRAIGRTLRGDDDQAAGDSVARLRASQGAFAERTEARLRVLEDVARLQVHRVGFVRYNSFSDVGSDLSFTLALLNSEGDGVLLTSIYSREETRSYGKAVRAFVPQAGASVEEQSAIALARDGAAKVAS